MPRSLLSHKYLWMLEQMLSTTSAMAPAKRTYYPYEFKNEVLQMVKSGAKRADIAKKYGINLKLITKWVINTDTIVSKVNGKVEKAKTSLNYSKKGVSLKKVIGKSIQDDQVPVSSSTPLTKEAMDKELMPILAEIMTLSPGNEDHPSVQWLINWLSLPERTAEEFLYVVGPVGSLQDRLTFMMEGFFYNKDERSLEELCNSVGPQEKDMRQLFENYAEEKAIGVFRAAAEALAVRCSVVDGVWTKVLWAITGDLSDHRYHNFGECSTRLSNWIIRVVGNPKLCPCPSLRLHMLMLYRTMVKFDSNNRSKAIEAMMFTFSSLDRKGHREFVSPDTQDGIELMSLFGRTRTTYPLSNYAKMVSTILDWYKNGNDEKPSQPQQVQSLTAILKFIGDGVQYEYQAFLEDDDFDDWKIYLACDSLQFFVTMFKDSLQNPMMLNVTAKSVMAVLEAVLAVSMKDDFAMLYDQDGLKKMNSLLNSTGNIKWHTGQFSFSSMINGLIANTIVNNYKERICRLRSQVSKESLVKFPMISKVIYNEIY